MVQVRVAVGSSVLRTLAWELLMLLWLLLLESVLL